MNFFYQFNYLLIILIERPSKRKKKMVQCMVKLSIKIKFILELVQVFKTNSGTFKGFFVDSVFKVIENNGIFISLNRDYVEF